MRPDRRGGDDHDGISGCDMIGESAPTTELNRFADMLSELARRVADAERSIGRATPWTAVTFVNAHVNYGAGFQTVQYRKQGDMVQVRGLFRTGAVGSTVFTLPVGFRPPASLGFVVDSNSAFGRINVDPSGQVVLAAGSTASTWTNFSFSVKA